MPEKIQELEIMRLASDGSGVGYLEGKAVFVRGLLPGEKARVAIYEEKKNYLRANIVEITRFAPERQDPPCPVFLECGGCDLQHLNYRETLTWKRRWVEDALRRIGGLTDFTVEPVIGMDNPWRYRNKAVLHRDEAGRWGYYKAKSNEVVEFADCLLLGENTNRRIRQLRQDRKDGSRVVLRENSRGEGLLWGDWDLTASAVPHGQKAYFYEEIGGLRFRVSPQAFLQVNSLQAARLYGLVLQWAELQGTEEVWDLYCGIGTMTLMLAQRAGSVIGIEENSQAVLDAGENAISNRIANARFLQGKVEEKLGTFPGSPDLVVTDPPRAGMQREVLKRLLEIGPKKIIYVSCDPATLARDLKILVRGEEDLPGNFTLEKVQPVDMFPWSHHVECVTLMSRVEK